MFSRILELLRLCLVVLSRIHLRLVWRCFMTSFPFTFMTFGHLFDFSFGPIFFFVIYHLCFQSKLYLTYFLHFYFLLSSMDEKVHICFCLSNSSVCNRIRKDITLDAKISSPCSYFCKKVQIYKSRSISLASFGVFFNFHELS